MTPALTAEEVRAILYAHNDADMLDELRSTEEGACLFEALVDFGTRVDGANAKEAAQLWVSHSSHEIAPPAGVAAFATGTIEIARSYAAKAPHTIPAGTVLEFPDGHAVRTDAAVTFGASEVGVFKSVAVTAVVVGPMGFIPAGEAMGFRAVARGVTGVGVDLKLFPSVGQPKHLAIQTDLAQPHPFASKHVGLYVEVTSVENPAFAANVGRQFQIARVNAADPWSSAPTTEGAFARSAEIDTTVDASLSGWVTGAHGFEWAVRDWAELGFVARTASEIDGGRRGFLPEIGAGRGRPQEPGEPDETFRARVLRKPQKPTPLGLLRKVTLAAAAFGFERLDVRIYEMGLPGASSVDKYQPNFPAAMGFLSDLHVSDMTTPETPDGMASKDPDYATLAVFVNPGLAMTDGGAGAPCFPRWCALVRIDTALPSPQAEAFRRAVFHAMQAGRPPGCMLLLYHPQQHGFP